MSFSGFKGALEFLASIRKNNNKEWFEAHRSEYDRLILEPSKLFASEMGEHLMALEPTVSFEPKINKSLFKIYRDIRRMGENKEPLKSRIGFIFPQSGWSGCRLQKSSFYMHFSPDELFVAVGVRWFNKPMLDAYREYIADDEHRSKLASVLESLEKKGYATIGKEYKRYPKGFSEDLSHAHLALHKAMASSIILDAKMVEDGDLLVKTLYEHYEAMLPLQRIVYDVSLLANKAS